MSNIFYYYRMHSKCGSSNSIDYISNEKCLKNFIKCISDTNNLTINIDNSGPEFYSQIHDIHKNITETSLGNGRSFLWFVSKAIQERSDQDIIYFVENDYIHLPNVDEYLIDGFSTGANYVTLYDHLDKYTDLYNGLRSEIFAGKKCYWRTTPSTCMTFAAKVKTLKQDFNLIKFFCDTSGPPADHQMFLGLGKNNRVLVSPMPGRCTHGESCCISPYIEWEKFI